MPPAARLAHALRMHLGGAPWLSDVRHDREGVRVEVFETTPEVWAAVAGAAGPQPGAPYVLRNVAAPIGYEPGGGASGAVALPTITARPTRGHPQPRPPLLCPGGPSP